MMNIQKIVENDWTVTVYFCDENEETMMAMVLDQMNARALVTLLSGYCDRQEKKLKEELARAEESVASKKGKKANYLGLKEK